MKEDDEIEEFSLYGGPLHILGCRLGLVRKGVNNIRLGVALGLSAWIVLIMLVLIQGSGYQIFSLNIIGAHVRLLLTIPLFFLCETWVFPRMTEFVREIVRSGLVTEDRLQTLQSEIQIIKRLKDSRVAEILFLLVAYMLTLMGMFVDMPGRTANWGTVLHQAGGTLGWAGGWYLGYCLPLFRFLVFRWIWHIGLWCYFLWCVSRLPLRLMPTHPDHSGGMGYLEVVQEHFTPLVLAVSAVYTASFAEDISAGIILFDNLIFYVPLVLILHFLIFICPLFIFSPSLWKCRITGLREYMAMASHYVEAFDRRWLRDEKVSGESQLGASDIQSLADLNNSVNVIQTMKMIPAGRRLLVQITVAAILPMMALLLLKYPFPEIFGHLLKILTGL